MQRLIHCLRKTVAQFKLARKEEDDWKTRQENARWSYLISLHALWKAVKKKHQKQLDVDFLNQIGVKAHLSIIDDFNAVSHASPFFLPCSVDVIRAHPVDLTHEETANEVLLDDCIWLSDGEEGDDRDPIGQAEAVGFMMESAFYNYERNTGDGWTTTLAEMAGLKEVPFGPEVFHEKFHRKLFSTNKWNPQTAWQFLGEEEKPHIIISMVHKVVGENDTLLKAEILTIIATMMTRLGSDVFEKHNIVPVMLLSFTGPKKGRIVLAHFDQEGLDVRTSKVYSFPTKVEAERTIEFFLQFMSCGMIGNTVSEVSYPLT